jgi:hypothetical protein
LSAIYTTLWYSKEQAPGYMSLVFFRIWKSAISSLSEQSKVGIVSCLPALAHKRTRNAHSSHGVREKNTPDIPNQIAAHPFHHLPMGLPDDNPSSFGDHYDFGRHAGLDGL